MKDERIRVRAVYKDGVLRPLEAIKLPENSEVEITIDPQGLAKRLEKLLKRIHEHNKHIPLEEVERDVELAIKEVRAENRAARKSKSRTRS